MADSHANPPTFAEALARSPQRLLVAIARRHGLAATSRSTKADLVARLAEHLGEPARLRRMLDDLSEDERGALVVLSSRGGRMSLPAFEVVAGPVPPFRPARGGAPQRFWPPSVSAGDALRFAGLVFLERAVAGGKDVVLPAEVMVAVVTETAPAHLPAPPHPEGRRLALFRNLAVFLASLVTDDVALLRGRWLAPRALRAIGGRLAPPEIVGTARSELGVPRVRFHHFLADVLGLAQVAGGRLVAAPAALAWLDQPAERRWREVWAAMGRVAEADTERWRRYRLPGGNLPRPAALLDAVATALAAETPGTAHYCAVLSSTTAAELGEVWPWWRAEALDTAAETEALLQGPLTELGMVETWQSESGPAWTLTPQGAWLLGRPDGAPPPAEDVPLALLGDLSLCLPAQVRPAAVLAVANWCEWPDTSPTQLRVSEASVARALARAPGPVAATDITGTLTRHGRPPMDARQIATVERWCHHVHLATLRTALLLSVPGPVELERVLAAIGPAGHLEQILPDHTLLLRGGDAGAVARRLARAGLTVREPASPTPRAVSDPASALWRAVAALVLETLARRWGLVPAPPPGTLAVALADLPTGAQVAAEAAAEDVVRRLAALMDEPAPGSPPDTRAVLADLEGAIVSGRELVLRYWRPGRGEWTERRVRPLRITWLGDAPALVAHCALRGAERTFRLDRIADCRPVAPES